MNLWTPCSRFMKNYPLSRLPILLGVAGLYFALARLGLVLATVHGNVSPAWPATGLAIGALATRGRSLWPAIACGAFVANVITPVSWITALCIAAGNTMEAVCGAWIISRMQAKSAQLQSIATPLALIVAASLAPLVSATTGVAALYISGAITFPLVPNLWITWWVGDALGGLIVAPLIIELTKSLRRPFSITRSRLARAVALLGALVLISVLTFGRLGSSGVLFAVFPLLLLAVAWFGSAGAMSTAFAISLIGVGSTFFGTGPFVADSLNDNLIHLQLFLTSVAITAIILPNFIKSGNFALPFAVMMVGWILSGWMFSSLNRASQRIDDAHFKALVDDATRKIEHRFEYYEDALRAGVALFAASESVEKQEWSTFARSLKLEQKYPGVLGIGVVYSVSAERLPEFISRVRANDAPGFDVKTVPGAVAPSNGLAGHDYYLITYAEPAAANHQAIGLDIASEAHRETAASAARDTGKAKLTRRIQLVQVENSRVGSLLLVPFYQKNLPVETLEQRRQAILGWIYAPVVTELLLQNVLGESSQEINLRFFEGRSLEPANMLYDSRGPQAKGPSVELTTEVELAGQLFTLGWNRSAKFPTSDHSASVWAGTSASFVSLLLAGLVMVLQSGQKKAESIVTERTAEIQSANQKLQLEISERLRAERSLRDSHQLQRAILDGANYAIISTNRDGIILTFNSCAERLLQYRAEELVQKASPALFHDPNEMAARAEELSAELGKRVEPGFESFVTKAKIAGIEEREWTYIRKDGSRFPVLLSVTALRDETGDITGYLGISSDLTVRREAERTISESQERFRSAFESAGIGMAIVGLDGRFQKVNRVLCEIVGYSHDELLQKTFQDITHPDDLDADLSHVRALIAGEARSYQMEKRYIHRNGTVVWIRLTGSIVHKEDGSPLQFVAQIEDITSRKQIEQALSDSEERTRLFAQHAPASVAMFDQDMRYLVVSRQWIIDYKLDENNIIGRSHYDLFPEIGEPWKAIHRRCLTGVVETNEADRFERQNGTVQWLRWEVRPWYLNNGSIGGIVMFTQDITQKRELELNLAKARDEALEASRLKSEFLATMSHEIRTPMNGIIGMSSLLLQSSLEPKQQEMANIIVNSSENLLTIINDILDFSKIEAGKLRIDPIDFNLRDVIEETVALLAPQASQKDLELICDIGPTLATGVRGDGGRIQQIITNLLGNALKFTEKGEVKITAKCLRITGKSIAFCISVQDTGIGIPLAVRPLLFQPFTQADGSTTRRFGGTGLGLAICNQLCKLMNGKLEYESTEGEGSRFWFELELERATLPYSENVDSIPPQARVLVVDDNETNRTIFLRQLSTMAVPAAAAGSVDEGLELLRRSADQNRGYTVLLLDWNMPDKDGGMMAEAVRADPKLASIRIIVLTSSTPSIDAERVAQLNLSSVLTKPVRDVQLRRSMLRAFGQKETPTPFSTKKSPAACSLRLLVAEDNPTNQVVAQMMMEQMGHSIKIAGNGLEVMKCLREDPAYDAILMDCQMPIMDGYETTREIRTAGPSEPFSRIPIIALTAYAMGGDRAKALSAGMDDYVSKPLNQEDLHAAFARCGLLEPAQLSPPKREHATAHPFSRVSTEPKLFDRARRDELEKIKSANGLSLWDKAVGIFTKEMPNRLSLMSEAANRRDSTRLATIAHTIVGSAANLGASALQSTARDLETAARAQAWREVSLYLSAVEQAWQQVSQEITPSPKTEETHPVGMTTPGSGPSI